MQEYGYAKFFTYNQDVRERTIQKLPAQRQRFLKYTNFKNENILPGTLLTQDLKLCHNDYYFLKLDLEKIVTAEIDLDEIYNCVQVKDIVQLLITKHRNVSSQSLHDRTCSVRIK